MRGAPAANWARARLKHVLIERDERSSDGSEPLLALSKSRGLRPYDEIHDREPRADSLEGYKRVFAGDIVMNKMQAWNGVFGLCDEGGIVSPDYTVLSVRASADAGFLVYLLSTQLYADEFFVRSRGMGTAFLRLNTSDLLAAPLLLPSADEQRRITDFLDRESQRLNTAAELSQTLSVVLEERKTSVAVEAVVGLPLVPLKRVLESVSGGEWGGEAGTSDVDVRCFRAADFDRSKHTLVSERAPLRSLTWKQLSANELRRGDLVLEKSGGGPSTPVGCSVLATEDSLAGGPSVCSNFAARLRPSPGVVPEYLQIVLAGLHRSGALVPFIKQTTGIQNLDLSAVLQYQVPIPEIRQQFAIVQKVFEAWEAVSATQALLHQEQLLIAERREALITAAVTGQLDVEAVA